MSFVHACCVRVFRVHEMFMEMFKEPNDDVHVRVCWWVWIELSAIAVRLAARGERGAGS